LPIGNWWDEVVVPRIVKCGCASEKMHEMRQQIIPLASGKVFELGCGAGANQSLYDPARVTGFTSIEPSAKLREFAIEAAAQNDFDALIVPGFGEEIPFADSSFDTVVSTFTLCSVTDHARALSELHRVLKPGGLFLYAEHGRAPDADVQKTQRRVEPVWKRLFGNCHLTRPVTPAIANAGFTTAPLAQQYGEGALRFAAWMEWGTATKTS
jgi:SAM-dependent methyltransferase